jgi:hypothetical protein
METPESNPGIRNFFNGIQIQTHVGEMEKEEDY